MADDKAAGMILRFTMWRDNMRGTPDATKFKQSLCPDGFGDVLPAFTPVDLEVSIKVGCRSHAVFFVGSPSRIRVLARTEGCDALPNRVGAALSRTRRSSNRMERSGRWARRTSAPSSRATA